MRARTSLLLALTCLCCATFVGCGQTGALYLPTADSEVVSKGPDAAAPAATNSSAAATADTATADAEATRKREPAAPTPAPK
jgi:predicted small lipoprotein YifL